jgi:hypothetical protein
VCRRFESYRRYSKPPGNTRFPFSVRATRAVRGQHTGQHGPMQTLHLESRHVGYEHPEGRRPAQGGSWADRDRRGVGRQGGSAASRRVRVGVEPAPLTRNIHASNESASVADIPASYRVNRDAVRELLRVTRPLQDER